MVFWHRHSFFSISVMFSYFSFLRFAFSLLFLTFTSCLSSFQLVLLYTISFITLFGALGNFVFLSVRLCIFYVFFIIIQNTVSCRCYICNSNETSGMTDGRMGTWDILEYGTGWFD
ncbi:hypothetical protein B0T22DRAFT_470411 [Podospora appendiculata]|uniref:Uncharacterized protein n=1 Tax=Podospora appendiculata TaxID=314037 RepID=A0AAE0X0D9_9PEZI|nr:hypothetical protein B0T22DRAFT_470411 [Podospora appendiculata]